MVSISVPGREDWWWRFLSFEVTAGAIDHRSAREMGIQPDMPFLHPRHVCIFCDDHAFFLENGLFSLLNFRIIYTESFYGSANMDIPRNDAIYQADQIEELPLKIAMEQIPDTNN